MNSRSLLPFIKGARPAYIRVKTFIFILHCFYSGKTNPRKRFSPTMCRTLQICQHTFYDNLITNTVAILVWALQPPSFSLSTLPLSGNFPGGWITFPITLRQQIFLWQAYHSPQSTPAIMRSCGRATCMNVVVYSVYRAKRPFPGCENAAGKLRQKL